MLPILYIIQAIEIDTLKQLTGLPILNYLLVLFQNPIQIICSSN